MSKITIEYASQGNPVSDFEVEALYDLIAAMVESGQPNFLCYSTSNIFYRIRLGIAQSEIPPESISFLFNRRYFSPNRFGAIQGGCNKKKEGARQMNQEDCGHDIDWLEIMPDEAVVCTLCLYNESRRKEMQSYKTVTLFETADGQRFSCPEDAERHIAYKIEEGIHDIIKAAIVEEKGREGSKSLCYTGDAIFLAEALYAQRAKLLSLLKIEYAFEEESDE